MRSHMLKPVLPPTPPFPNGSQYFPKLGTLNFLLQINRSTKQIGVIWCIANWKTFIAQIGAINTLGPQFYMKWCIACYQAPTGIKTLCSPSQASTSNFELLNQKWSNALWIDVIISMAFKKNESEIRINASMLISLKLDRPEGYCAILWT